MRRKVSLILLIALVSYKISAQDNIFDLLDKAINAPDLSNSSALDTSENNGITFIYEGLPPTLNHEQAFSFWNSSTLKKVFYECSLLDKIQVDFQIGEGKTYTVLYPRVAYNGMKVGGYPGFVVVDKVQERIYYMGSKFIGDIDFGEYTNRMKHINVIIELSPTDLTSLNVIRAINGHCIAYSTLLCKESVCEEYITIMNEVLPLETIIKERFAPFFDTRNEGKFRAIAILKDTPSWLNYPWSYSVDNQ